MIDDYEYYRNKLKKPACYPARSMVIYENGVFRMDGGDIIASRQTFSAVTVLKDGVLTVEWKVEAP